MEYSLQGREVKAIESSYDGEKPKDGYIKKEKWILDENSVIDDLCYSNIHLPLVNNWKRIFKILERRREKNHFVTFSWIT